MATTTSAHDCILCKKSKSGRFARPKSGLDGPWKKGHLPSWYCYTCLPQGQGSGEEVVDVTVTSIKPIGPKTLALDKKQGLDLIAPLQETETEIGMVLHSQEDYLAADGLLGRIQTARKWWRDKMYGTKAEPGPIPSIRSGLDMLYALTTEVDAPRERLEEGVKGRMRSFKLAEARAAQAIQDEKDRLAEAAERELQALLDKQEAAKTPAAKAKVQTAIEEVEQTYIESQQPQAEVVQGAMSTTKKVKKPILKNLYAFYRGLAEGTIPLECAEPKLGVIAKIYRDDPETVAAFPGIHIVDDITIVGR